MRREQNRASPLLPCLELSVQLMCHNVNDNDCPSVRRHCWTIFLLDSDSLALFSGCSDTHPRCGESWKNLWQAKNESWTEIWNDTNYTLRYLSQLCHAAKGTRSFFSHYVSKPRWVRNSDTQIAVCQDIAIADCFAGVFVIEAKKDHHHHSRHRGNRGVLIALL